MTTPLIVGVLALMIGTMAGLVLMVFAMRGTFRCDRVKIVQYQYPYRCVLFRNHNGEHEYEALNSNRW